MLGDIIVLRHTYCYIKYKANGQTENGQTGTDMEKGVDARTMSAETLRVV